MKEKKRGREGEKKREFRRVGIKELMGRERKV